MRVFVGSAGIDEDAKLHGFLHFIKLRNRFLEGDPSSLPPRGGLPGKADRFQQQHKKTQCLHSFLSRQGYEMNVLPRSGTLQICPHSFSHVETKRLEVKDV